MPNWCYNRTYVYGPAEDRKRFHSAIETDKGFRIVNLLPMPELLEGSTSTFSHTPEPPEQWKTLLASGDWTQEDYDTSVARHVERYNEGQRLKEATGYTDWYNWANVWWGTKWGDCDTFVQDQGEFLELSYNTAWGPFNENIWLKACELFPTLGFITGAREESNAFVLVVGFVNGDEVYYEEGELPYAEFESIEDDEDRWENMNDWEHEWLERGTAKAIDAVLESLAETNRR